MKTLFLIRHAKSSWELPATSDFDRPLNTRGKADAPEMARRLAKRIAQIDHFISSPAKRAKKTAQYFIREFNRDEKDILFIPELYNAEMQAFYDHICRLDKNWETVALFSHNPGITEFANSLTEVKLDNMPTCGIFGVSIPLEDWAGFTAAKKTFLFFDYPKSG